MCSSDLFQRGADRVQAVKKHLVGFERRRLPVVGTRALALLFLRGGDFAALAFGIAVGAAQGGVMGVPGGRIFVFAHAVL